MEAHRQHGSTSMLTRCDAAQQVVTFWSREAWNPTLAYNVQLATAELYNPSTGVWQTTGSLNVARVTAAALLQSGQVLVAGGYDTSNSTTTYLASAELYDPSTGHWSSTASMKAPDSSPHSPCTAYERRCAGKQRRPILQSRHGRLESRCRRESAY